MTEQTATSRHDAARNHSPPGNAGSDQRGQHHGMDYNVDPAELAKFEAAASRWWDPSSEFGALHAINPLRLGFIERQCMLAGSRVVDVGCGGGLLSEAMASAGADVLGIDLGKGPLQVARLHALETGVPVRYERRSAESLADEHPDAFDLVTCMEMLEHVPEPALVIAACSRLVRPGGVVVFSTINRNVKSWLQAIVAAEYVLELVPKGTHDHASFIRPSEMARWARQAGLQVREFEGMSYDPISRRYFLTRSTDVNYLAAFVRPGEALA